MEKEQQQPLRRSRRLAGKEPWVDPRLIMVSTPVFAREYPVFEGCLEGSHTCEGFTGLKGRQQIREEYEKQYGKQEVEQEEEEVG